MAQSIRWFSLPLNIVIFHGKLLKCQRTNPIWPYYMQTKPPYPQLSPVIPMILCIFKCHISIPRSFPNRISSLNPKAWWRQWSMDMCRCSRWLFSCNLVTSSLCSWSKADKADKADIWQPQGEKGREFKFQQWKHHTQRHQPPQSDTKKQTYSITIRIFTIPQHFPTFPNPIPSQAVLVLFQQGLVLPLLGLHRRAAVMAGLTERLQLLVLLEQVRLHGRKAFLQWGHLGGQVWCRCGLGWLCGYGMGGISCFVFSFGGLWRISLKWCLYSCSFLKAKHGS